jgi:hypothetical protein
MSDPLRDYLPPGSLHVRWNDRYEREGAVVLVADRRPRALTDRFFAEQIPRWQRLGIALNLCVYEDTE